MEQPADLNPRIIESLYAQGLALSDAVRATFDLTAHDAAGVGSDVEDPVRIAQSCEALRTTTRMMHAVAWLLNHRAYLKGEISEFQLRRHGRIAANLPQSEPERLALLAPHVRELILATERFHAQLVRLDATWREEDREAEPAIARLRRRLDHMVR